MIVGEIGDVVAGVMRLVLDEAVDGRAMCICAGGATGFGSKNFDLYDDVGGGDGAVKLEEALREDGLLGALMKGRARHS